MSINQNSVIPYNGLNKMATMAIEGKTDLALKELDKYVSDTAKKALFSAVLTSGKSGGSLKEMMDQMISVMNGDTVQKVAKKGNSLSESNSCISTLQINNTAPSINEWLPEEIQSSILSFLDAKHLGKAQSVCKLWNKLANDDQIWKVLFLDMHDEEVPEGQLAKIAFYKKGAKEIQDLYELSEVVHCFFCTLKWDKKKQLEVSFPQQPGCSIIIKQSFCPEGKIPAEEIEYYQIEHYQYQSMVNDPFHAASVIDPYISSQIQLLENGTIILNEMQASFTYGYNLCKQLAILNPRIGYGCSIFKQRIDVGYGNTLGSVFDTPKGWTKPVHFLHISGEWVGLIPLYKLHLKFVIIDQLGNVKLFEKQNLIWEIEPKFLISNPMTQTLFKNSPK